MRLSANCQTENPPDTNQNQTSSRQMNITTRKTQNSVLAFAGWKKVKGGYAKPESFGGRAVTRRVALASARHNFKAA